MNRLLDSHFHSLHMEKKGIDINALYTRLFKGGFMGGIDIGLDPDDLTLRLQRLASFPGIQYAAGIYPGYAEKLLKKDGPSLNSIIDTLQEQIETGKPVALGEIGLDWHWNYGDRPTQTALLAAQIETANTYGLPVLIHNREADKELIDTLKSLPPKKRGIIHCFSSGWETASILLDMGFLISFAGNVTYKGNTELREVLSRVPIDQLILETDSPYLAPVPRRGRPNSPENMQYIYSAAAETRNMDVEELAEALLNNYRNMFTA